MTDQGSQFCKTFIDIAKLNNVMIQRTSMESHHSLSIGVRYHGPLRNTFLKLRSDHSKTNKNVLFRMVNMTMNDTLGPEGIVPSALVFGDLPSIRPFLWSIWHQPTLSKRAEMAYNARKIMTAELTRKKICRALNQNVPKSDGVVHLQGDLVYVWRETPSGSKSGEWTGYLK